MASDGHAWPPERERIAELEEELEVARARIADLEEEVFVLEEQLTDLEDQLEEASQ